MDEDEEMIFVVKDEKGEEIARFGASTTSAAAVTYLVETAGRAQRKKVADWMIENGFATGHGDTIDDLLKELTWQVKELRTDLAHLKRELEDESV